MSQTVSVAAAAAEVGDTGSSRSRQRRSLLLWLAGVFLCSSQWGWANDTHSGLEQISLAQGLSQSTVFAIEQDATGYMWFGTRNGLNRFDGYRFRHFLAADGLPSSFIWSMQREGDRLWLGTQGGGLVLRQADGQFVRYPRPDAPLNLHELAKGETRQTSAPRVVMDIELSHDKGLWLATQDAGLQFFDIQQQTFTAYNDGSVVAASRVLEDSAGNVWVATEKGLSRYTPQLQQWQHFRTQPDQPDSLSDNQVHDLLEDSSYRLWVATGAGLNRFNPASGRFDRYRYDPDDPDSLSNDYVWTLLEDRRGRLWVGTNSGLNLLNPVSGQFERFLEGQEIKSLYEDASGILWVGTYYGGVFKLDDKRNKFHLIRSQPGNPDSLAANTVNDVYEEIDGTLWLVGDGVGLSRIDPDSGEVLRYQHNPNVDSSLSNNHPMNIMRLESGDFLLGHYSGGMNRFNPETGRATRFLPDPSRPDSIGDDTVFEIIEDRRGRVWLATWRSGLNRYHPDSGSFSHYRHAPDDPHSIGDNYVQTLLEDSRGRLWVGTASAGLQQFLQEERRFVRYPHDPADASTISHNHVYSLRERDDGKLWVGTESGGLNLFDPVSGRFEHFMDSQGLLQTAILGILPDRVGNLWLSTRNGLLRYNPDTNFAHRYDEADGVQSTEFIAGSHFYGRDGVLYFGGVNGLNYFRPEQVENNRFVPPVVMTRLQVLSAQHQRDIDLEHRRQVTLSYDEQPFSLEFAALNYTRSNLNRYRYRLEGLDNGWLSDSERNQAIYHRVPPGQYRFYVRGSNNDGLWNARPAELTLRILPPWWLSHWAYLGYLSALGLLCWGFWQRRRQERAAARERDLAQRSEQMKQEFLARMSHEIRTPLSGMLGMMELLQRTSLNETQRHYLNSQFNAGKSLLQIINDILEYAKLDADKVALGCEVFDLQALLEDVLNLFEAAAEGRELELHLDYQDSQPQWFVGDAARLRQVFSNLVGNAVKFTGQGRVSIRADVTESAATAQLVIAVEDTGIGIEADQLEQVFEQFYQATPAGQYGGTGLGLPIARQLVELMGGKLTLDSQPGEGTQVRVELCLPLASDPGVAAAKPDNHHFRCRARVLLVEDNETNADALKYLLRDLGCEVAVARNGYQALAYLELHKVDLVFMDRHMPKMDGITATQRLRADKRWRQLPIVALTASQSPADKSECLAAGMDAYLLKPLLRDQACQVLSKYCPELVDRL